MKQFKETLPFLVLVVTMLLLIAGCATAEPMRSSVPEDMYESMECPKLLETGQHINDQSIRLIEENEPLAIALKQISLSYYTVYTIECLEKGSDEYKTIRDYVAMQQKTIYNLKADEAEAYECKNGLGM